MSTKLRNLLLAVGILVAGQAAAQVTFYEHDGFGGRSFTADRTIFNFDRLGYNDLASSASVRGGAWEVCTDARFEGRCVVLRPGDYPSLRAFGLNDRISSVRQIDHVGSISNDYYARRDRHDYSARNDRRFMNNDRYEYRNNGWRFDRWENRWERY